MNDPGADKPQKTGGMEGDVRPGMTRKDGSQGQQRWPYKLRWPLGLACTVALIIGTSLLYWYETPDRGLAETTAVPIGGYAAPSSPPPSGSTVRVLVDAQLGTVLIEFRPESGQTSGSPSSAGNAQSGAARCAVVPLSDALPITTAGASPFARPAAHVPATAGGSTFGRWGACPSGRGSAVSILSR